jgi:hypothetical protein
MLLRAQFGVFSSKLRDFVVGFARY